jgi:hypothetical protein
METSEETIDPSKAAIAEGLVQEFVLLVSQRNTALLFERFGTTAKVFEEIIEIWGGWGFDISEWQPPIFGQSHVSDIYQMNDPNVLGVEINLWARGKPQEAILRAHVDFSASPALFDYRCVVS